VFTIVRLAQAYLKSNFVRLMVFTLTIIAAAVAAGAVGAAIAQNIAVKSPGRPLPITYICAWTTDSSSGHVRPRLTESRDEQTSRCRDILNSDAHTPAATTR
jgi:hypothetical protein